jgi:hypothetical protein
MDGFGVANGSCIDVQRIVAATFMSRESIGTGRGEAIERPGNETNGEMGALFQLSVDRKIRLNGGLDVHLFSQSFDVLIFYLELLHLSRHCCSCRQPLVQGSVSWEEKGGQAPIPFYSQRLSTYLAQRLTTK